MAGKLLNFGLVAASLLGYLEWGGNQRQFLWQMELAVFEQALDDPAGVIHPFIVLPLAGQLMLIATLFQSTPGRRLSLLGLGCLALLLGFICFVGVIGRNPRVVVSTLPFLGLATIAWRHHWRARPPRAAGAA